MTKYIEGEVNEVPRNNNPLATEIEDIYYLLGHFYFRNKSWVGFLASLSLRRDHLFIFLT